MLNEVDVSFSSVAEGSNYMIWQLAHLPDRLTVSNLGIRDNRPFYINVRVAGKNNIQTITSLGPVVMAHQSPANGTVNCTRLSTSDWALTMADFNEQGGEVYYYHVTLKIGSQILLSLPMQSCSDISCVVPAASSDIAPGQEFTTNAHVCNVLGVCVDAVSVACSAQEQGGSPQVNHVWEASEVLEGTPHSYLCFSPCNIKVGVGTVSEDEDFMDSSITSVIVYFEATAGNLYEVALVAGNGTLAPEVLSWVEVRVLVHD